MLIWNLFADIWYHFAVAQGGWWLVKDIRKSPSTSSSSESPIMLPLCRTVVRCLTEHCGPWFYISFQNPQKTMRWTGLISLTLSLSLLNPLPLLALVGFWLADCRLVLYVGILILCNLTDRRSVKTLMFSLIELVLIIIKIMLTRKQHPSTTLARIRACEYIIHLSDDQTTDPGHTGET